MELTETAKKSEIEEPGGFDTLGWGQSHTVDQAAILARSVLGELMPLRRLSDPHGDCAQAFCRLCEAPHLSQIISAVRQNRPISFVLPAFPGKSPNRAKVLGPLPDMAERCALEHLQQLCDRIGHHYAPGAQIILCSDGRVFSDVVGMRDEDVTDYQNEIRKMIKRMGLSALSTFHLEERYERLDFGQMRNQLMTEFGKPLETLRDSISRGKSTAAAVEDREAHRLYCGITRFLLEDACFPGQTKSRTALQKESRTRAYSVIQKSQAWGELIETHFPEAVRLSIHPQSCGSKKMGIRLIEPDNWQTPWHGVAVQIGGRFVLMKRARAEALGAMLVRRFDRPSHFVLTNAKGISILAGESHEA